MINKNCIIKIAVKLIDSYIERLYCDSCNDIYNGFWPDDITNEEKKEVLAEAKIIYGSCLNTTVSEVIKKRLKLLGDNDDSTQI